MPERREIPHRLRHGRGVVGPHGGEAAGERRMPDRDRGHPEPLDGRDPGIVGAEVHQDRPADEPPLPPGLLEPDLLLQGPYEPEQQRTRMLGQDALHARDEVHVERFEPEQPGRPADRQPHHVHPGPGQRPRGEVRLPAQLTGGGEDPVPGRLGEPRLVVEGEGHRPLGHAGARGDVLDGDAGVGNAVIWRAPRSTGPIGRSRHPESPSRAPRWSPVPRATGSPAHDRPALPGPAGRPATADPVRGCEP